MVNPYKRPQLINKDTEPSEDFYPAQDSWANIGVDLLELAKKCLVNTPNGVPEDCHYFDDEPLMDCCDFLAVYPQQMRPILRSKGKFPEENFDPLPPANQCDGPYWAPRFEIVLGRPCRPIIGESSTGFVPADPAKKTEWSRNTTIDAQTLVCCVFDKLANGYEVGGRPWMQHELFPQQVYTEGLGLCTRIRFRIMFDDQSGCCVPKRLSENQEWWEA